MGFSSCDIWAQLLQLPGSRTQAHGLWHTGLVALGHVGSSQTRDWTCVSCNAGRFFTTEPAGKPSRPILYHQACIAHALPSGWRSILPWAAGSFGCWWFTAEHPLRHCPWWKKIPCPRFYLLYNCSPMAGQYNGTKTWASYLNSGQLWSQSSAPKHYVGPADLPTYLPGLIPHQDSTSPFNQLYFPYPPTGVLAKSICQ